MIAIRLYDYEALLKLLSPYGCERVSIEEEGFEVWKTGWGASFTLRPENDRYDSWQYDILLGRIIGPTMPEGWNVVVTPS